MPHILRVPSDVTLEALRSALVGVRSARVAVIFPLGRPSHLGTGETVRELHSYALILNKEIVVIGGDEHLRAVAVAAGFAAATSLEEWEETLPELRAVTMRGAKTRPLNWELTDLALISDDWFAVSLPGALDDPYSDEPPAYVKELLATGDPEATEALGDGDTTAAEKPGLGLVAEADEYDDDEKDALALRDAHEHYEEHITKAIRETGGVSRPLHFQIRRLTSHTDPYPHPTNADDDTPGNSPVL